MSQPKLCFVIGPIGKHNSEERKHADQLLKSVIRPTFSKHFKDFKVERADHISRPGLIDSQVITYLIEADLVLADLTTRNANAFYELGIRHMLQKPVIHLFRRGDDIPADIAPYRAVEFSFDDKFSIKDSKIALRKAVTETQRPTFTVENPVSRSAGYIKMLAAERTKDESLHSKASATPSNDRNVRNTIDELPTLLWRKRSGTWTAEWHAKDADFKPQKIILWKGNKLSPAARKMIPEWVNRLDEEERKHQDQKKRASTISDT